MFAAAGLGAASFVVLTPMGYPLAAVLFCAGLALGLLNTALVQRSAARFAAMANPSKGRFAATGLARLGLISLLALGLALAVGTTEGLAVFAGLAALQLVMIFLASVPLVRELRQSATGGQETVSGKSAVHDQSGAQA